jgi:hypothetical protein
VGQWQTRRLIVYQASPHDIEVFDVQATNKR